MVSVCLPSDALLQHLPSYLGFSYLGRGVSLHGCSSKAQPLLLTLDEGYLLTTVLGSSPGGSRLIQRGDGIGILGKSYLIRSIKRLEKNSVVGKLVEKKRLNNLVYVGYQ